MKNFICILIMLVTLNGFTQNQASPTLSNFRVEDRQNDRVYFDSDKPISGSSVKGFVISGKQITNLNINNNSSTGHFFTIASSFNFWDNNTIRYEGGSNVTDTNGNALNPFTLQYIDNMIAEPKVSGRTFFVNVNGSNNNDGSSESKAWASINYAAKQVKAGDVVYIKAGDYGSENVVVPSSGTASKPIRFIGYKNSPGDSPSLTKSIGMKFNSSEMPLLKNGQGNGIDINKKAYLIFKNIQIDNYSGDSFYTNNLSFTWFDNVYLSNSVRGMKVIDSKSRNNRLTNSYLGDFENNGVRFQNQANLIENNFVCTSKVVNMDYYIVIYGGPGGGGNIVRNNIIDRYGEDTHTGHGISMKVGTYGWDHKYNLIENCTVRGVKKSLEARHYGSDYGVWRNITIERGRVSKKSNTGGIAIMNGASYNTFENIHIDDTGNAILVLSSTEDADAPHAGTGNVFKNCVFNNVDVVIDSKEDNSKQNRVFFKNKVINCTINNSNTLVAPYLDFKDNEFVNCIISNIKSEKTSSGNIGFTYRYSNFYNNSKFSTPSGNGNISQNPMFMDAAKGNFRLKSSSKLIDAGTNSDDVKSDFDGNERPQGNSQDIGAYEYQDKSTSSVEADAGEDQVVCIGESVVLTASGGSVFEWSTGETSKSIEVSPTTSTVYAVKVSAGSSSDTDEVKVTVNNVQADAGKDVTINKGEGVTLTATGGDSYLWNNGETLASISISPNSTKVYSVVVYKNGCSDTDSVKVTVLDSTESPVDPTPEDVVPDIPDSNNSGNDTTASDPQENQDTTVAQGSTDTQQDTTQEGELVTEDANQAEIGFDVYPNPSSNVLNVDLSNTHTDMNLSLISATGSIMYSNQINSNGNNVTEQLDVSRFEKGIYFVRLSNSTEIKVKKVILI